MASNNDKHIFALHYPDIDREFTGFTNEHVRITITDRALIQRISNVLRLREGDQCIVFGNQQAARCELFACEKKTVHARVMSGWPIQTMQPYIDWYVPITQRSAFEDAISYLTIFGARTIYPIITDKSKRNWGKQADFERIRRVMIAAAEQSKQFAIPEVTHPYSVTDMPYQADYHFVCDPHGLPISKHLSSFSVDQRHTTYAGLVGPEAGLTQDELAYLDRLGFQRLRLVPSILRMETAVATGVGLMRSLLTGEYTPDSV